MQLAAANHDDDDDADGLFFRKIVPRACANFCRFLKKSTPMVEQRS